MAAIGILGGTFDPVHNAHLAWARAALEHLKLDQVLFIPTGATRYRSPALASGEERAAMLRLAVAGEPRFRVDTRELQPEASGYTVDTLKALRSELGEVDLYLLIGADQYEKLATWHRPEEVKRLAKIAVFARPGFHPLEKPELIPMQPVPISASEIRTRLRHGGSPDGLVPAAVAKYIARRKLYS